MRWAVADDGHGGKPPPKQLAQQPDRRAPALGLDCRSTLNRQASRATALKQDAFGIPFIGFPVERRKRPKTGLWGQKPIWIEASPDKARYRVRVPNVRSWAVGIVESLATLIKVSELSEIRL